MGEEMLATEKNAVFESSKFMKNLM